MQHPLASPAPSWSDLESCASKAAQQLSARQLEFTNEQPPPSLFEHLVVLHSNAVALVEYLQGVLINISSSFLLSLSPRFQLMKYAVLCITGWSNRTLCLKHVTTSIFESHPRCSVNADGDAVHKAPLLHLLQTHPLVFNVYNSRLGAAAVVYQALKPCPPLPITASWRDSCVKEPAPHLICVSPTCTPCLI